MDEGIQFIRDLMIILLGAAGGGWGARRLGLSPVVGYLGAGLIIGAPQVTFVDLFDAERIEVLAQVGLVLLMFTVGAGIRLQSIRKLGVAPIAATLLTALIVLTMGRSVGAVMGMSRLEGLFFAGMLMVSSSAIIAKILSEKHLLHQRMGQMALSQTLLEDFVAVVMLAVLGSAVALGGVDAGSAAEGGSVWMSLGRLLAFVLLVFLTGLVLLPQILSRVRRGGGEEIHILLAGGLVFAFAFLSVLAGYSLALGAFLFGLLVAESDKSRVLTRSFSGMRDIFAAIFFVSIGMSVDPSLIPEATGLIIAGTLLALVGRVLAAAFGWMAACQNGSLAVRTALYVTPVGEFSFIIAGFGVASGVLPEKFQIAAIGIAFASSIIAPLMMNHQDRIVRALGLGKDHSPSRVMETYREIWRRLGKAGSGHALWGLLRPRFWQVGREIIWIAGAVIFAHPVYDWLLELSSSDQRSVWSELLLPWFWFVIALVLLMPIVSLVRNFEAMALMTVDFYGKDLVIVRRYRRVWVVLLQSGTTVFLVVLLGNLLPWWSFHSLTLLALLAATLLVMVLGWKRLIRMQSEADFRIAEVFRSPAAPFASQQREAEDDWGLDLRECQIPEGFFEAGKSLRELGLRQRTGASVVAVERHGTRLGEVGPGTHLFPGDTIFLLGREGDLEKANALLNQRLEAEPGRSDEWADAVLEGVVVPEGSPFVGRPLSHLKWPRLYGVQVVAARAGGSESFTPAADWPIPADAQLLLAGDPPAISEIKRLLLE